MATLYVVATPIGNLEDMTFRAVRVLGEADVLACEDTRRTRILFERYEISSPATIFSYHEHNEDRAGQRIMEHLRAGRSVALCTNAGFPGISDPGYRVIAQCSDEGFGVEVIPGASAVPTALLTAGLSTSSFVFKGFAPRKSGPRRRFFEMERDLPHTVVFFESPHRIGKCLADARAVLGDRLAAVCIELTKKFEEVHRGYLGDLAEQFHGVTVRGEVTVVVAGNNPKFAREGDEEE